MIIKCVRCEKEIESPNRDNAYYIVNVSDRQTWGITKVERIVKAPLTQTRINAILREKTASQREYKTNDKGEVIRIIEHPFTMNDFDKSTEIYADTQGRREITIEEEKETAKTAIICKECLNKEEDRIIW